MYVPDFSHNIVITGVTMLIPDTQFYYELPKYNASIATSWTYPSYFVDGVPLITEDVFTYSRMVLFNQFQYSYLIQQLHWSSACLQYTKLEVLSPSAEITLDTTKMQFLCSLETHSHAVSVPSLIIRLYAR